MGRHTPGPWIINVDPRYPSEPCIDAVIDGVVWHVALCHNAAGPDDGCAEANARLIAAGAQHVKMNNEKTSLFMGFGVKAYYKSRAVRAEVFNHFRDDFIQLYFRLIADESLYLRKIWHAARHVLEPFLVSLVIRDELDR